MGKRKKKQKPKTVPATGIGNVHVNIDYNKLAEAFVKAEKKSNEENSYTSNTFAALTGLIFRMFAGIGVLFSLAGIIYGIVYLISFDWQNAAILKTIFLIILITLILILVFSLSILLFRSAKEIEHEKDRQFVVSVFSAIVSFTALIVALVALNK